MGLQTDGRLRRALVLTMAGVGALAPSVRGADVAVNWLPASGNWNVATNWSPNAVVNNGTTTWLVQIGNSAPAGASVFFIPPTGTSATITTLSITNGADLVTSGFQLNVLGLSTISGASSTIRVDPNAVPATTSLQTFDLDVTGGGALQMNGGIVSVSTDMDVTSTGVVSGFGTLNVGDTDAVVEKAFQNSGLIQVSGNTAAPGVLTIHANGNGGAVFDTVDLDGDNDIGDVNVSNALANVNADTLTLVVDGPLSDALGGGVSTSLLQIGQRDTVTFNKNFTTAANFTLLMDGGTQTATLNGAGAITDMQSTAISIFNKALISNNMTLTGTANTITLNAGSSLELAGTVTIADASAIAVPSSTSELIISGNTTVTELAGDFDWDGAGTATTTVKGTGLLTLNVNHVDQTNDLYGGTLNLDDDGDATVNNVANIWTMAGTLHKRNAGISTVGGDAVNVSAGIVTVDAGTLSMPVTTLGAGSAVTVNGTMSLGGGSVLAGPTSISGTGTLRMLGTSTVTNNTTINTAAFDWDGAGAGTLQTINDGVVFTVNSSTWDADDAGDMDDPINIGGTGGTLAVNNVPSWTMTRTLTTNTAVSGITSLNGNSRMILSGALAIWNANGQTAVNAPVTFGASSTVNIAAAGFIRLNGGDAVSNFNRVEGATINGPGALVSINTHELRGFGTINAPITFQNASSLRADDGTLNIGGAINEVSTIGTADSDGILNVVNAWNSNVAASVVLNGGTLQGGAITVANANGIKGKGVVSSRVVNNTRLEANVASGTLVFETAANDNDWDGAGNIGLLAASNGGTLEVRDNATFTYGGTVTATGGSKVYSKGFGFNFAATSAINLTASTLQTDESSDFNGPINVAAGGDSTIQVQVNRFLTIGSTSTVTLNSNLKLVTNNGEVKAGATFSGAGALIVPAGSHLIPDAGSNINVLLANEGTIRPSGFNTVGTVTMQNFQQTDTGRTEFEITGTLLNQYDRIVTGVASLDGYVNFDIDGAFVPALGNTFSFISAPGGVVGTFDSADVSGMPVGLTFALKYLPTSVQAIVVSTPVFAADFDDDGDVDNTDLAIWRNAFNLNQLGDADGDNDSDLADWTIWREQFGSHPIAPGPIVVPEPASLGALLLAGLFGRRRRRAGAAVAGAAILGAACVASAAPTLSVVDGGLVSGNRQWSVRIAPDATLIASGHKAVATELGIEITGSTLLTATKNAAQWPFDLPGVTPPTYPSLPPVSGGMAISGNKLFASFGSDLFNAATPVEILKVSTVGSGSTTLSWGQYTVTGRAKGIRIAQGGQLFDGQFGSVTLGGLLGDFDNDGTLDADDIDLMHAAAEGPVTPATMQFDLNNDGMIERSPGAPGSDADIWVTVLKDTGYADANFDKVVNFDDLVVMAQNYNLSPRSWSQGNFNDVPGVDFGDLVLVAQNYNMNFGSLDTQGLPRDFAADWVLAQSLAPEPAAVLAAVSVIATTSRRRRGR